MKTSLTIFFLVIANIIFRNGCRFHASEKNNIKLNSGSFVTQPLDGNVSSGYLWTAIVDNPDIIAVERPQLSMAQFETLIGNPNLFRFKIRGLSAGKTNIHFLYKKPWQQAGLARFSKTISVEVTGFNEPVLVQK